MTSPPPPIRSVGRSRFQIRDILALVVGYGMAALFIRAFWPTAGPGAWLLAPALALYGWLGLALSGPVLLLRRGSGDPAPPGPGEPPTVLVGRVASHTWAEWAWVFVGSYWIVLGLFVIPARLRDFKVGDAIVFGLVPVLAALGFRLASPQSMTTRPASDWTHPAAVWLLLTWPVAWGCLVVVGRWLK
jgi:hypothetical protein